MASILYQLLTFLNRVLHLFSTMFISGMCTLSFFGATNLYEHAILKKWSLIFGVLVGISGLFNIYHLHKWFRYYSVDRHAKNFAFLILLKIVMVLMATQFLDLVLEKMDVHINVLAVITFKFYMFVAVFMLSTFMKYYKEMYVVKGGSELDTLV